MITNREMSVIMCKYCLFLVENPDVPFLKIKGMKINRMKVDI